MYGNFQYNMTTQTEYEQMKQKNTELQEENQALKQSLQELIEINNELTDSMEEFNCSGRLEEKNKQNTQQYQHQIQELKEKVQKLTNQLEQVKSLSEGKENEKVMKAMQGLCESFRENQLAYDNEVDNICEQIQKDKKEWQQKIQQMERDYVKKIKMVNGMILTLRKKEQILSLIEKKHSHKNTENLLDLNNRVNRTQDTCSERQVTKSSNAHIYELKQLQERQKQLSIQLNEKVKTIKTYEDIMFRIRAKLSEKV